VGSTLTRAHATVLHPAHHRALLYDLHGPASLLPRIAAAVLAGRTGRAVLHPVTPAPFQYHPRCGQLYSGAAIGRRRSGRHTTTPARCAVSPIGRSGGRPPP